MDRNALWSALLTHAVDLGAPGPDYVYGTGRADALASANALCPATTPTPSPTPSPTPQWSATNFHWYQLASQANQPTVCDTTKPVPPNMPDNRGLCTTFDLSIPDGSYSLRVLWKQNGTSFADTTYPSFHLFTGSGWSLGLLPPLPSATYSVQVFANGVSLGSSQATVIGPTATATPTKSPTPTPSPTPPPTPTGTPTPAESPTTGPSPSPTPTVQAVTATPTQSPTGPMKGDLNCNGGVGVTDVMLGLKIYAGLLSSLPCAASADVDCNGVVNGLDVLDLLRYVDHLPSLVAGNCTAIGSLG